MKKLLNISLCLILTLNFGYSQSIKRSVICSFGSSSTNSTTYLSETFGQPSSIETVSDGNNYIRQGFEQPIGCVGGTIFSTTNPFICSGSSVTVGNSTYNITGTYIDSLVTVFGCDSVITTNLTIWGITGSLTTESACDSFTWNSTTYNSSGIYSYITPNSNGCDSVATLDLTILLPTTSTTTESACDSYNWNSNTYTSSGTYTYATSNANGCDSVATLDLTILLPTTSSTIEIACDSYNWNGNTYSSTGTYTYNTSNSNGCDSIATLVLTISALDVSDVTSNTSCFGLTDGSVDVTVLGGILPYAYLWDSGQTTEDLIDVPSGNYVLTITDINSCSATINISIDEPLEIDASPFVTNATCEINSDASIDIAPYGGTMPYTYLWNNGQITEDLENIPLGEYTVLVTDFNGCQKLDSISVGFDGSDNCLFIPTLFTPNGDNIHDDWEIDGLDLYPDIIVKVFNRWGQLVFESNGYTVRWDGKHNGNDLPFATYYYAIELNNGSEPLNGPITIKR